RFALIAQLTETMAITTPPKNAVPALWTAFALALAVTALVIMPGQPEMAVPLSTILASTVEAHDGGWLEEITSWRAEHAVELQKPDGWLGLPGVERPGAGGQPVWRGQ